MNDLYGALESIDARPAPFEVHTVAELWTDPHTSARMLECHLDGTSDLASRSGAFIDRSAAWIADRFALGGGARVADFGCGPGLYTTRLAAAGARVHGIDFSERSIRYARELSRRRGVSVDHVHADYLEHRWSERFDLVTMIMCDFCALGPVQRRRLLDVFQAILEPGGALLLDVVSLGAFERREERLEVGRDLLGGFWSPEPYFGFLRTFKYDAEKVVLDRYTIVEPARVRVVYNWLQHYDPGALTREVEGSGLVVEEVLGDVAGGEFDPAASEFAVVARKPAST